MVDATDILYYVAGALHILAALGLLYLNFADRLNRVLALYLVLIGGAFIVGTITPTDPVTRGLAGMFWHLNLASGYPLFYLAACYRDRFGQPGLRRIALPVLILLGVTTEVLYLWNPGLIEGTGFRPLKVWHFALILLGPGIVAALLAHDAFKAVSDHTRRHLLWASLGFAFYPTAFGLHLFVPNLMSIPPVEATIGVLGLLPAVFVVLQMARLVRSKRAKVPWVYARNYLLLLLVSPLSVLGLALAEATLPRAEAILIMRWIMTFWLLAMLFMVAYAILRHQLFGIEIGLKSTLRLGFVPGLLVALFFVAGELLENISEAIAGPNSYFVAGGVVFVASLAYRPMQRFANRFANAAMPDVDASSAYASSRNLQLYESAVAAAWEDGILTRVERIRLDRLRERLKITPKEAGMLEAEFARRPLPA